MKFIYKLIVIMISVSMLSGCVTYVGMPDLVLVSKDYPKPDEVTNLSFALAEPDLRIRVDLTSTASSGLMERIRYDANKVACFITPEAQKILLSKGFTITEKFQSYNAMTFTQKRNTSALFYPEIIIDIEEKSQLETIQILMFKSANIKGRMQINAKVNIIMLEPLSGEKLWVKSIPVTGYDEAVIYQPMQYAGTELNGVSVPEDLVPIADKIDKMLSAISQEVLEATAKYVERHEFEFLNSDIVKLKGIKRY
jgi:hypothetical protein